MAFSDWHNDNKNFALAAVLLGVPIILGFIWQYVGFLAFIFMCVFMGGLYKTPINDIFRGHNGEFPDRKPWFKVFCWLMAAKCIALAIMFYGAVDNFSETIINFLHLQNHFFLKMMIPIYSMLSPFLAIGYVYMSIGKSFIDGAAFPNFDSDSNIQALIEYRESVMGTMTADQKAQLMLQTSSLDMMASNTGPYSTKQGQKVKSYVNGMLGGIGGGEKKLEYIKTGKFKK